MLVHRAETFTPGFAAARLVETAWFYQPATICIAGIDKADTYTRGALVPRKRLLNGHVPSPTARLFRPMGIDASKASRGAGHPGPHPRRV